MRLKGKLHTSYVQVEALSLTCDEPSLLQVPGTDSGMRFPAVAVFSDDVKTCSSETAPTVLLSLAADRTGPLVEEILEAIAGVDPSC